MTKDEIEHAAQSGEHCFLYREALQNDWIDFSVNVRTSGMWYVRFLMTSNDGPPSKADRENQTRAYLCESLATALDHADPIIALRAYGQACEYAARLNAMGTTPGARHNDAVLEACNRLETLIRTAYPVASKG